MPEKKPLFVGGNGGKTAPAGVDEEGRARDLARRYRCEFIDLRNFHIQHDLFRSGAPPRG